MDWVLKSLSVSYDKGLLGYRESDSAITVFRIKRCSARGL